MGQSSVRCVASGFGKLDLILIRVVALALPINDGDDDRVKRTCRTNTFVERFLRAVAERGVVPKASKSDEAPQTTTPTVG